MFGKDVRELTLSFGQLTAKLYHRLASTEGNLFFSPFNITTALLLIHAGARGRTQGEIEHALGIGLTEDQLHPAFRRLCAELAEREIPDRELGQQFGGIESDAGLSPDQAGLPAYLYCFASSVGLWRQDAYECEADYLRTVREVFGGDSQEVDFASQPAKAAAAINQWAGDKTKGLINQMISQELISPLTRLVLASATYFKAAWLEKFEKSLTETARFELLDDSSVDVQMMESTTHMSYARHDDFETVQLPYASSDVRFAIVLPSSDRFDAVERSLDGHLLDAVLFDRADYHLATRVRLRLPRFRLAVGVDLLQPLRDIGIQALFDEHADLSGISPERGFHVDSVLHNSFVSVDEDGTEAGATTSIVMLGAALSEPEELVAVTVDRPFLFFIVDRPTRTILFAGRCLRPRDA